MNVVTEVIFANDFAFQRRCDVCRIAKFRFRLIDITSGLAMMISRCGGHVGFPIPLFPDVKAEGAREKETDAVRRLFFGNLVGEP